MPDAEVNIMKRWSEPQLAQTALQERILGGARIDHDNRRLIVEPIVAGDEKSLMLQCCGPEIYRDNNSEEFQSRDVRRGVEDKIREGECKAFVESRGSAASQTSVCGETKISEGPVGRLDNRNTIVNGKKSLPPSQIVTHFQRD